MDGVETEQSSTQPRVPLPPTAQKVLHLPSGFLCLSVLHWLWLLIAG
jgi:hypothetical protein